MLVAILSLAASLLPNPAKAVAQSPTPQGAVPVPPAQGQIPEGWTQYRDQRFGYSLALPSSYQQRPEDPTARLAKYTKKRSGRAFLSEDRQSWLVTAAFENINDTDIASYRANAVRSYGKVRITYSKTTKQFYVISGTRTANGGEVFYERAQLACSGNLLTVWTLTYPAAMRDTYDRVVEGVSQTFKRPTACS